MKMSKRQNVKVALVTFLVTLIIIFIVVYGIYPWILKPWDRVTSGNPSFSVVIFGMIVILEIISCVIGFLSTCLFDFILGLWSVDCPLPELRLKQLYFIVIALGAIIFVPLLFL